MASNDDEVIRKFPTARFYRESWPDLDVPDGHVLPSIYYHHAIGKIITRWNSVELVFQNLIAFVCGLKGRKTHALLTHVGAMTLHDAAITIARDIIENELLKDEMRYCALLFDSNRVNRNFIAHCSTDLKDIDLSMQEEQGVLVTKRSARGGITTKHYLLSLETLRKTADEIFDCDEYLHCVIGPLSVHGKRKPTRLPPRPPMPEKLPNSHPTGELFDLTRLPAHTQEPPD